MSFVAPLWTMYELFMMVYKDHMVSSSNPLVMHQYSSLTIWFCIYIIIYLHILYYICMFMYIYAYICVYTQTYIHIIDRFMYCGYINVFIYLCIIYMLYIYVCVCVCVSWRVREAVCECVAETADLGERIVPSPPPPSPPTPPPCSLCPGSWVVGGGLGGC